MKRFPFLVLICLLFIAGGDVRGQDSLSITLRGEIHPFVQQCHDVALSGQFAFCASGMASGLRVVNLFDPSSPVEAGYILNTDPCPGVEEWMADKVRVSGDHAYVLYYDGTWTSAHYRLCVYDVSAPMNPRPRGWISLPDHCTGLWVEGEHVYITAYNSEFSGVVIIDVSDPSHPLEAGSIQTPGMAQGVAVVGDHAFVADNMSLVVYDVSDPGSPVERGRFTPGGDETLIQSIALVGEYAYVVDAVTGIRILDVSDLSAMEEVGSIAHGETTTRYSALIVSNHRILYLRDEYPSGNELVILDVSTPASPAVIAAHSMPGEWWFYGFDCTDGLAAVAAGTDGLMVMDTSTPGDIVEVSRHDPHDLLFGLAVSGDHVFLSTTGGHENLLICDVSDPSRPEEITAIDLDGRPFWLSVRDDLLYVPGVKADGIQGVSVLDISDPTHPEMAAHLPMAGDYSGVPLSAERYGDYVFVALAYGGVQMYDLSDINAPVTLGSWTLFDQITNQGFAVRNVKVSWPYLFVPDESYGLHILNASNPHDIVQVAGHSTPGQAWWVDLSSDGSFLYMADASGGLRIFDVSDPLAPAEVGSYDETIEQALHVAVSGDSVYVSDGGEIGLHVIDVSDPSAPIETAWHRTPGAHAQDVTVAGGLVYLADMTHFQIFELTPETPPEGDADRDGVPDEEDNCPSVYNPDQVPVEKGNIDCEGGIDILDVLAVVNHILGNAILDGQPFDRADCNGDGDVNILDAVAIINVILGYIETCE